MSEKENAFSEDIEIDGLEESGNANNDYDIDDLEFVDDPDGTNDINIPAIESEDDEDEKISEDKEAAPEKEVPAETEAKEEPEDQDDQQKEIEPQEKQLPEELIERAKAAGMSQDDIESFDQIQLEKVVSLIAPETAERQDQKTDQPPAGDEEFAVKLDEDLYDPELLQAMKDTASEINRLKAELKSVSAGYQQSRAAEFEREFEGMINSLGDDFNDLMGKGGIDEIGSDSDLYQNRCKVLEEMNALAAGFMQTGKKLPSNKQLFERAVNAVFGDKIKSSVRKSIASQLKQRAGQFINRPGAKGGKDNMSPEKRAMSTVAAKLQEYGANADEEVEDF